jgi:hypothetical protein
MLARILSVIILLLISLSVNAKDIYKVKNINLDTAEFYLFDLFDGKRQLARSIDAYYHDGRYYIAITPFLEPLLLKYKSSIKQLDIELNEEELIVNFINEDDNNDRAAGQWFRDDIYTFIDIDILSDIFGVDIDVSTSLLRVQLQPHSFKFPYQLLQQHQNTRSFNQYSYSSENTGKDVITEQLITIPDEYRLLTMPTGYLKVNYAATGVNDRYLTTLQAVADVGYHSANITYTNSESNTSSRLLFSRYPQFKGDKILGIWDTYSIGDISNQKNQLDSQNTRGLGLSFKANKQDYNRENMVTGISKDAPPGWEADLFRNGIYITTTTVPDDGLLVFDDLEVLYGANHFKISLYGPYGEEKQIDEYIDVNKNPLAKGDMSYQLTLQNNDNSLLSFDVDELALDSINAGFDYGIYDEWQFGINLSNTASDGSRKTSAKFRNLFSMPNFLLENNLLIDQDSAYKQITNLSTSFIKNDSFVTRYESSGGNDTQSQLSDERLSFNYNLNFDGYLLGLSYQNSFDLDTEVVKLNTSKSFNNISFTNTLQYNNAEFLPDDLQLQGNFSIGGRITKDFRIIASIPYSPKKGEIEKHSTSINFSYRMTDPFENNHRLNLITSSIGKDDNWALRYNVAWTKPSHQLLFGGEVNSNDDWNVNIGFNFYFGYDYHNNRPIITSNNILHAGAMDIHAYLDRQMNGIPDVLDYNLQGVKFLGNPSWAGFKTNEQGKVHLIGANTGINRLTAQWQDGSDAIRNDYLIYSHPGSMSMVNLPFYLTTEIETFVVLNLNGELLPLRNAKVKLVNHSLGQEQTIKSDQDGYISSIGLIPGDYSIIVENDYLTEKGFTASIIGYHFTTPSGGGFIEIPAIILTRENEIELAENIARLELTENNFEQIVDVNNQELTHLPPKGAFETPLSMVNYSATDFIQKTNNERFDIPKPQSSNVKIENLAKSNSLNEFKNVPKLENIIESTTTASIALYVGNYITFNQAVAASADLSLNAIDVIEKTTEDGQLTYQIRVANFEDKVKADAYYRQNYSNVSYSIANIKVSPELSSGWVIQLSAFKNPGSVLSFSNTFSTFDSLYMARKMVNGEYWYCLISEVYQDKRAAMKSLAEHGNSGIVIAAAMYTDVVWNKN